MKKKVSIILCLTLILGMPLTVSAADNVLMSEKTYGVITDVDDLMWLGAEQLESMPMVRGMDNGAKQSMTVTQTVKERTYQNGAVEKEMLISEIGYQDKNGKLLTAKEIARAIGYTSGSRKNDVTQYGVTLINTIYATLRLDSTSALIPAYRCDRVTSTVIATSANVLPTTGATLYVHYHANERNEVSFTANMVTGQQVFTLYPTNPQFAQSEDVPMTHGLYAQSYVNLTNGQRLVVQNGIPQDAPWN